MKNIETIKYDAEYASQVMTTIPYGYIDKTLCGVGLSSVALENNEHVILAVPSVPLINNKIVQYPNERFSGRVFGVQAGVTSADIEEYVKSTTIVKIMVSYDSLHKVEHLLSFCRLIVDESNRLTSYKKLKAKSKKTLGKDVITKLFSIAEKYKDTVSFLSATPIPLEYMPKWISEIPQIKIEWNNTVKAQPILMQRTYPYSALTHEIIKPMVENDEIDIAGVKVKKAIIFVNSISAIMNTLKNTGVNPDDVRVVMGDTVANDVALKDYSRLSTPNKLTKFTFVTGSGFDGIDLHDEDAISIVVSNTDKSYHLVDISTDLKQAISRQRNKKNPNYGKYIFLYNQTVFDKTEKEMLDLLDVKYKELVDAIYLWEVAKKDNRRQGFKYTKENPDFVAYTIFNDETEEYTIDEDTFQADRYFILEVRRSFEKGFDIRGVIDGDNHLTIAPIELPKNVTYDELVDYFKDNYNKKTNTIDWGSYSTRIDWIKIITTTMQMYGKVWKDITHANAMIKNYLNPYGKVSTIIKKSFSTGKRYTRKEVKETLTRIYKEEDINRVAKHTDLYEFFDMKELTIRGERFVEILKK
jgi:hypothetical protein